MSPHMGGDTAWLGGAAGSKDRDKLLLFIPGRVPRELGYQEPEASVETQGHG